MHFLVSKIKRRANMRSNVQNCVLRYSKKYSKNLRFKIQSFTKIKTFNLYVFKYLSTLKTIYLSDHLLVTPTLHLDCLDFDTILWFKLTPPNNFDFISITHSILNICLSCKYHNILCVYWYIFTCIFEFS